MVVTSLIRVLNRFSIWDCSVAGEAPRLHGWPRPKGTLGEFALLEGETVLNRAVLGGAPGASRVGTGVPLGGADSLSKCCVKVTAARAVALVVVCVILIV